MRYMFQDEVVTIGMPTVFLKEIFRIIKKAFGLLNISQWTAKMNVNYWKV